MALFALPFAAVGVGMLALGVQYESRRVAINTSADNVGGFQQRLEVESVTPGLRFARRFTVPVYATGAQSVWVAHTAASQP